MVRFVVLGGRGCECGALLTVLHDGVRARDCTRVVGVRGSACVVSSTAIRGRLLAKIKEKELGVM